MQTNLTCNCFWDAVWRMSPGSLGHTFFSVCREESWVFSGRDPLPSWKKSYPFLVDVCVALPGQSQGIFNQHSEAIPSAADKGANVLGWDEDICLISLMSKCSTLQSLAHSVPAHTKNCFWNGNVFKCSSPAQARCSGHSRNPAYFT